MKRSKADQAELDGVKFVTPGHGVQNQSSSFELGPRYWPPVDDTTVLALYPMHSSHADSALLERRDFTDLLHYLCGLGAVGTYPSAVFELPGPQNTLRVRRYKDGGVHFTTFWNSTPNSTSVSFRMDAGQVAELVERMTKMEADGWEGWKSGTTVLTSSAPGRADWCMEIVVDRGTGYLADGEDYLYYRGRPADDWDTWDTMAKFLAGDDDLIEWKVSLTPHSRYWAEAKQYPMFWKSELAKQG